ncbi:fasciclin domain-containing protein [Streptomyces aureus]|uniref:fasciclin domain-containing protein n=1 Tax=Streptomyces aureus TaxID=193461 RepID=UPI00056A3524|nr:fasciclin domain-containing protein [Streptomyces aureus]
MNTRIRRSTGLFAAAAVLPLALTACSSGSGDSTASDSSAKPAASATKSDDMTGSGSTAAAGMDQPFGPACSSVPKSGEGSFDGMAKDPKILTYHVVGQKLTPKDLENGSFTTLEKSKLTTSGSGESYTVNDSAKVVCGNVKTANANVYIIDTVLMPPN